MTGALAALLSLQLAGEVLARGLQWPVPGPVVGLILLLIGLVWRPQWAAGLRGVASGLLQHLSLLFVPAGVGVMLHLQRLGEEAWAIGVALALSTWLGMAATALTVAWLMRRQPPHNPPQEPEP